MPRPAATTFSLLAPPYRELLALDDQESFPRHPRAFRGAGLVWQVTPEVREADLEVAANRPGGLPLLVLLPPSVSMSAMRERVLAVLEEARPMAVLPHHPVPDAGELSFLLAQGPASLPGEVMDYLWWRGMRPDQETRRLIQRMAELSSELQTLGAVSRAVYLSRRALGRRFHDRGLSAPSRWLQGFRVLRAAIELQSTEEPLERVAAGLGYPDSFTLSNQMERLVGARPSLVRERLGWEWVFESWLRSEWAQGHLKVRLSGMSEADILPDRGPDSHAADGGDTPGAKRSDEAA
jgi:AraC-like DNA-binding protein